MKSAEGIFKKLYAIRFEPGEDVMESLQSFCEAHDLKNGVIVSGIGSLEGCSFFDPSEIPGKPGLYEYGAPIEKPSPIELISMGGIISTDAEGKPSLHIHASFADEAGNGFAGHFKAGNRVLTTVELVVAEIEGIAMTRAIDPLRGVPCFTPVQL